jgi:HK97 family phage portal protein
MTKLTSWQIDKQHKAIVSIPGWAEAWNEGLLGAGDKIINAQHAYAYVPLIYRAMRLRCDSLISCPVYVMNGDNGAEWPFPQKLHDMIWKTEAALLLKGAAYWLKLDTSKYKLKRDGVQWLNPFTMTVSMVDGEYIFEQDKSTPNSGPWSAEQMVYFKDFNPADDIGPGVSPTDASLGDAQLLRYMSRFAAYFFEGGAMPVTILGVQGLLDKDEQERVQGFFKRTMTGIRNAFRVLAVNTENIKPQTLTQPLKDLAMPELTAQARKDICWAFGIPQTMLDDAANFATAKEHRESFWQDTMKPRARIYEDTINDQLLNQFGLRIEFRFDEMDIFQEDEAKRATSFFNYVGAGMKPSIAAQILGIDLPEGMEFEELDERMPSVGGGDNESELVIESRTAPVRAELKKWETFEVRRFGKENKREFNTESLPLALAGAITGQLEKAESKDAIRSIFADAERWTDYP